MHVIYVHNICTCALKYFSRVCGTMETEDNRPKWMIELENRKRKPRLAHEAGAGSPCLTCKADCPGLDLHFWRKICKNCKCSRDDHDVDDDEFPQFDLLFGPSGKPKKKSIRLRVANKKQKENEITFDWIPPNTTKELAADYMKALPEDKLPIKGSSGAALRRQQLQKQLPLHDVDHKVCDELSEQERQQFEKYLENLKRYAGQGKVIKIIAARPFSQSLMTPANATDMQRFSPQHKPQLPTNNQMINLRTPSSFVTKIPPSSSLEAFYNQQTALTPSMETIRNPTLHQNAPDINSRTGQYHHALFSSCNNGQVAKSVDVNGTYYPEQQLASSNKLSDNHYLLSSKLKSSLPKAQNVRPATTETPRKEIKTSSTKQFAQEENVPASDQHRSLKLTRSNALHKKDEYLPAAESACESVPHTGHSQNLQDNVQRSKVPVVGQYFNDKVPSSRSLDNVGQKPNAETSMQNRSMPSKYAENLSSRSNALHQEMAFDNTETCSHENSVPQNLASLEEFSHETARLAELMLSEALLPPSVVHAKEIIGSTLDKDKLKFIQQQLSAKYSKDDPVAQSILRSQKLDVNDLQYTGTLNKSKDTTKNVRSSAEKEMERTAIIAATQYPSAILSVEQNLRKVIPKYSDSPNEGKEVQTSNVQDIEPIKLEANPVNESIVNRSFSPNSNLIPSDTANYNTLAGTINQCAEAPSENKNAYPLEGKRQQEQYIDNLSFIPHSLISDPTINQQYLLEHLENLAAANKTKQTPNLFRKHQQFSNDLPTISDPSRSFVPVEQQSHLSTHPQKQDTNTLEQNPERHWNPNNSTMNLQPANFSMQQCYKENSKPSSNKSPLLPSSDHSISRQLQAELSCQPIRSNVIYSESLQNPVFPEGIVESLELMQNPASVDQLKGAMEELTEGPIQIQKCHKCHEATHVGDVVVTAEKAKNTVWHPGCFICSVCNELLVDLVYFYHKGKLYCGRDLATHLNIPRCFACDELIFVREYTVAEGHNYHIKHFCCWDCDMPLAGQQYISENDRPLCLPCYQKTYAKTCMSCKTIIAADQKGVAVKHLDFHATDACFCCFMCKKSLLSGKMGIRENKPFCSKECITKFLN